MADPVIELSGVWKIFGSAEQAALGEEAIAPAPVEHNAETLFKR